MKNIMNMMSKLTWDYIKITFVSSLIVLKLTVAEIILIKQILLWGNLLSPKIHPKKPEYVQILKLLYDRLRMSGDFNDRHEYWGSALTWAKNDVYSN